MGESIEKVMKMKKYLTIGQVAKIKKVGIKSLRYYEKIGVLIPAYTNPDTNYRYYTLDQLLVLDTILLCIDLEIPLKKMNNYTNADDQFQIKLLLEDGKKIASKKIKSLEQSLSKIELNLSHINKSAAYQDKKGLYTKHVLQRYMLRTPSKPKLSPIEYQSKLSELFSLAQEKDIYATFPHGTIEDYKDRQVTNYTFLETVKPEFETDLIRIIPEGDYLCFQQLVATYPDTQDIFKNIFQTREEVTIIISSVSVTTFSYDRMFMEFQTLI
ncbi:MerR family DNA-binding transcriptional regulator [Acetobacterium tundrae]|uniref:MerR family DNA-binding transcriptional regulator n=2 Tax=Acetobacterium tundrae TaxID=132932 RepID=A0ABR6WH52_9FIRM|nr:MerR family DNA-binding transcriptional regulator [Acetobacterium tundrae]